jgi:tetratricopeptide (TPR) repeat protein
MLALIGVYGLNTYQRAAIWGSEFDFYLTEVANHPDSPRANFKVGAMLITSYPGASDKPTHYRLARHHLEKVIELSPKNSDGLFGLIFLNLQADKPVPESWLAELKRRLEFTPYSPLNITTSQFSFLVKWHMAGGRPLPTEEVLGIFGAVLRNPTLDRYGKAGIYNALRAYYQEILHEPENALKYAELALATWPERAHYLDRLVRVLAQQGRSREASERLRQYMGRFPAALTSIQAQELAMLAAGPNGIDDKRGEEP